MISRFAWPLLVLLSMAACTAEDAPDVASSDVPATVSAATTAASEPVPAEAPIAATSAITKPANATTVEPAAKPLAEVVETPEHSTPTLVRGVDYEVIPLGQPWQPLNGQIEVVEVFGYVCPACNYFLPMLNAWKKGQPDDVRLSYIPAPFGPAWEPYAKAFYVADALGLLERSHDAVFRAVHVTNELPGEGEPPDEAAVAEFYSQYGVDADKFLAAMNSFGTKAKVNRGKQFMLRSDVHQTPTLVINGKYRVKGKSLPDTLRIASELVAMERAAVP